MGTPKKPEEVLKALENFDRNRKNQSTIGEQKEQVETSMYHVEQPKEPQAPVEPTPQPKVQPAPKMSDYNSSSSMETDPDLMISTDIVPLPSKGLFYPNGLKEIEVEYLTSKDEDILTSPALIEKGTVLDVILQRKIKTPINVDELLVGDKNAILMFLRMSSYGSDYTVQVTDPITGKEFNETIDLKKFKFKEITEMPDANGEYSVEIPMRKKLVKFRILTAKEIEYIIKQAEEVQTAYGTDFNEIGTNRLKASVTEIGGKRDKGYINKFIEVMPALDALTIRKKMEKVSPDIDLTYEFTAPSGKKFKAPVQMGIDFFFPSLSLGNI
jgi:hypothetical protein